jgi:hypothetical protein
MAATGEDAAALAAQAARLVIEDGLEYGAAKRKAARDAPGRRGGARPELPSNEAVEDEVRAQLALFHAESQPAELAALRRVALRWMARLAEFRPHLSGAVWRGTATRLSAVHLDLYCDDPKAPEIALINAGVSYDVAGEAAGRRGEPQTVLSALDRARDPALGGPVTLFLSLRDADDLRGALVPDARGQPWRGDARALERLLQEEPAP